MKKIFLFFSISVIGLSCEKAISFKPNPGTPSIVVDASIENGQPPIVILSKSVDYFSKITPEILAASFVHGAEINLSNGLKTHRLKEYTIPNVNGFDLYYYSLDSSNLATAFLGELNTSYQLTVSTGGTAYSATTTIPALTKTIDSLWWKKAPNNPDSTKVVLMSRVTDPPGFGNYIRYYTKVKDSMFFPGIASVFDDQVIDGTTYVIEVEKGVNRNEKIDLENYSFFKRGDSITVKFTNIDKATYDFWRTVEFSYQSIGNPFSSPTKVLGNVKGALGYFGGYAVQFKTITIPN